MVTLYFHLDIRTDNLGAKCLNEFNKTCVGGDGGGAGFALSREELASKPATVLTALFASLGLPIEFVPRAIRKARELQETPES